MTNRFTGAPSSMKADQETAEEQPQSQNTFEQDIGALINENQRLKELLKERFDEIIRLTKMYLSADQLAQEHQAAITRQQAEFARLETEHKKALSKAEDKISATKHELDATFSALMSKHAEKTQHINELTKRLTELSEAAANEQQRTHQNAVKAILRKATRYEATSKRSGIVFWKQRKPQPMFSVNKIRASGLFDAEWYLSSYPDVAASGMDPVEHYVRFGAGEGRDPGPLFNTNFYLTSNADVAQSKINPLLHYLDHGWAEGRSAQPAAST